MNRYSLYCWPDSQSFVSDPEAILVMPPEDDDGSLDSSYMVPDEEGGYALVDFPDSQQYEDEEDVLSAYDVDGLFVPVELL